MKKIALLVSLVFSLGLNAEVVSPDTVKTAVVADVLENGKNEIKRQVYSQDGSLESYTIAKTNLAKGTYTEYYHNGILKKFTIVN
ncbi:MAG: hypothetical protein ACI9TV_003233 [Sulfurimonas sp.]|jgi:hypothetical protein|uniref:hypothetical protein n=1 Tax=Sulfurimonas sp. TaxID=2022749 RepID=UPI0039E403E2